MQEKRQQRICRLLQQELALIFQQQTRQTHGTIISVTEVRVSPDLSVCTAYLSVFPDESTDDIVANIRRNTPAVRYELGQRVRNQLRIIPELRFFPDNSQERLERIDQLLKQ